MPDRSSTKPINVKNGMASNVSLAMTPNIRSGKDRNSGHDRLMAPFDSGASSTPTMKYSRPQAPSEKATGYPSSRNTISDANMIGAMFWAIQAAMKEAPHD